MYITKRSYVVERERERSDPWPWGVWVCQFVVGGEC